MTAVILLGGVLTPARFRFAPLLDALGSSAEVAVKELELYGGGRLAEDYALESEVEGLSRFADGRGYERFHLYGYSIGGAIALAYTAAYGDRVLSLALDEPTTDFSAEDRLDPTAPGSDGLADLPEADRMRAFVRHLVRPGVELGPPPALPPLPEMALRPAGLAAVSQAAGCYQVDEAGLREYRGPVYVSYGSLSNQRWEAMAVRLQGVFADCVVERYEGRHHLDASHQAEPRRVAAALHELWKRSGG